MVDVENDDSVLQRQQAPQIDCGAQGRNVFSIGGGGGADEIAALVMARNMMETGLTPTAKGAEAVRRSLRANASAAELVERAAKVAEEQRKVLNYVASDPVLNRILERAGMVKRHARIVERTRKADIANESDWVKRLLKIIAMLVVAGMIFVLISVVAGNGIFYAFNGCFEDDLARIVTLVTISLASLIIAYCIISPRLVRRILIVHIKCLRQAMEYVKQAFLNLERDSRPSKTT